MGLCWSACLSPTLDGRGILKRNSARDAGGPRRSARPPISGNRGWPRPVLEHQEIRHALRRRGPRKARTSRIAADGGFSFPGWPWHPDPRSAGAADSVSTLLIIGALMLFFGITRSRSCRAEEASTSPTCRRCRAWIRRGAAEIPGRDPRPAGRAAKSADAGGTNEAVRLSRVLADTEDVLEPGIQQIRPPLCQPRLVLFTGAANTACGTGMSAMGPFLLPLDRKIYVDLAFYDELEATVQAPGDFAQAYVIAHEVGHHVQTLLGIARRWSSSTTLPPKANQIQVRMELQADCLAGVWANLNDQLKNRLQPGDIEPQCRERHRRRYDPTAHVEPCRARCVHPAPPTSACAGSSPDTRAGDADLRCVQDREPLVPFHGVPLRGDRAAP